MTKKANVVKMVQMTSLTK